MSGWKNTDQYANNMPKYLDTNYPGNTTVYLINQERIANSGAIGESVVHQGWVKVYPGVGPLTTITVDSYDSTKKYANADLIIRGVGANAVANLVVTGTGANNLAVSITNSGAGYWSNTKITANTTDANNGSLTFSFSGGRIGRDLTETLVALSNAYSVTANSANTFFKD